MIHSIQLKNFKQHEDLFIEFEQGLNVINGNNGAGKSTVLKAIMFALFGAAAAGKKEHLSTWNSSGKMEVTLTATISDRLIKISRGLDKSVIYEGEELLASGQTPCTKWVEQELGLDVKTFKHLLYAPQGETQALLKLGAADLQRKIETITKVDGIDKILELISKDLSVLSGKMSILSEVQDVKGLENQLQELYTILESQSITIIEKETMLNKLAADLNERRQHLHKVIIPTVQQVKHDKKLFDSITAELNTLEQELTAHAELVLDYNANYYGQSLKAVQQDIRSKEKKLMASSSSFDIGAQLKATYDRAHAAYQTWLNLEEGCELAQHVMDKEKDARAAYLAATSYLKGLLSNKLSCPTCERPYEDAEAIKVKIAAADEAVSEAEKDWKFAEEQVEQVKVEYGDAVFKYDYQTRLDDLKKEADSALNSLKTFTETNQCLTHEEVVQLRQDLAQLREDANNLERDLQYARSWEQKNDNLLSQVTRLKLQLSKVPKSTCEWTDEDISSAERMIEALESSYKRDLEELNSLKIEEANNTAEISSLKKLYEDAVRNNELRKQAEAEQAERKELQSFLRNNRARLMNNTWEHITALTGAYAAEITEGALHSLTRDDEGNFLILEAANTVPVNELSGGQQSIVGLALRMALGQTFYGNHGFILLDEVSAELSDQNAAAVAGFLSGLGTQVVMVSHRQGDSVNASHVVVL